MTRREGDGRDMSDGRDRGPASGTTQKKLSYNEKRELEALPAKIEALEKEIADIQAADPVKEYARYAELPAKEAELERLVDRWAALAERAPDLT